jgi:hypothetical protein
MKEMLLSKKRKKNFAQDAREALSAKHACAPNLGTFVMTIVAATPFVVQTGKSSSPIIFPLKILS